MEGHFGKVGNQGAERPVVWAEELGVHTRERSTVPGADLRLSAGRGPAWAHARSPWLEPNRIR